MGKTSGGMPSPPDPVSQMMAGGAGAAGGAQGNTGTASDQLGNNALLSALSGQIDKSQDLGKQSTQPLAVPPQVNPADEEEGTSKW